MRRYTHHILLLLAAVLVCALQACNRNDGDIGDLFGQWLLKEMTVDGDPAPIECDDYNWRFQSNVVCITINLPYHEYQSYFGSWSREGDRLLIDYTHKPEGSAFSPFNPPPGMHLSGSQIDVLIIRTLTHKDMILEFTDSNGASVKYKLKKIN